MSFDKITSHDTSYRRSQQYCTNMLLFYYSCVYNWNHSTGLNTHTHTLTHTLALLINNITLLSTAGPRGRVLPLVRSQRSGQRLLNFMNLKRVCKKSTCTWNKSGMLSWFLLFCGTCSLFYTISTVWEIKTLSHDWLKVRIPLSLKMSSANKSTECSRSSHSQDALCWDWVHLSIWVCPGNLEGKTCHHPHS